jgi:hypothetical protein
MSVQTKVFVNLFRAHYLNLTDSEYKGTPDKEMLKITCKTLKQQKHSITEYLGWLFNTYLPDNQKFCPPSIKWACSAFCLDKFLFENKPRK